MKIAVLQSRVEGGSYVYGSWTIQGFKLGLQYATGSDGLKGPFKLDDRDIRIKVFDTEESPERGAKIAEEAITGWGADILFGGILSSTAIPIEWTAEDHETPYFICPAASPGLTQKPRFNKYTFRVGRNSWHELGATAYYYNPERGYEDIAFLAIDTDFGITCVDIGEKVFGNRGAEVVAKEWVPPNTEDFGPYVEDVKEEDPDGVFIAWAGDFAPIIGEMKKQEMIRRSFGAIVDLLTMNRLNFGVPGLEGVYEDVEGFCFFAYDVMSGGPYDWLLDQMKEQGITPDAFVAKYSQEKGDWADKLSRARVPELMYGGAFASAQFIVEGVRRNPELDADGMIDDWEGMTLETPLGETTIRPEDHQGLRPMHIARATVDDDPDSDTQGLIIGERVEEVPSEEIDPPIKTDYRPK